MYRLRLVLSLGLLFSVAAALLACGVVTGPQGNGLLQALTISPAIADAKNFPNGQVQFTATAVYMGGKRNSPAMALWTPGIPWALDPQNAWPALTLNTTGLVSCGTVMPATYMIFATAPVNPSVPVPQMKMSTPQMTATAQLTCP